MGNTENSLLLVSATEAESHELMKILDGQRSGENLWSGKLKNGSEFHQLITGIGGVSTAFALGDFLANHKPVLAIQYGIGGSFELSLPSGKVVEVIEEIFADLGAMSPEGFMDLERMGFSLMNFNGYPLYNRLQNPSPSKMDLPKVTGLSVNTVSGDALGILRMKQIWNAQVESMEGAAFYYSCLKKNIPFIELRGISNFVEPRNKDNWRMKEAIQAVQQEVLNFLEGWKQ